MKVSVVENLKVDLSESLLNEIDGIELSGTVDVSGAVLLDKQQKIMPLSSSFLSGLLNQSKGSPKTSLTYGRNLGYILEDLKKLDVFSGLERDELFISVQRTTLQQCLTKQMKERVGVATIKNREATLKTFFTEFLCVEQGRNKALIDINPFEKGSLLTVKANKNLVKDCDINTTEKLMNMSEYERERLIVQFVFDSGVRSSEFPRVTKEDINEAVRFYESKFYAGQKNSTIADKGYILLGVSGSKGRGGERKERFTIISEATLKRILSYHSSHLYKKYARKYKSDHEKPIFFNAEGRAFTQKNFEKLLVKLSDRAIKRQIISKPVSPHKLRHGFAYEILRSPDFGEDYLDRLVSLQKTLGHNDLDSTQIYTRIPVDLYKVMSDEDGVVLTKATKMELLSRRTKLKITIKDKK